jgi:RNA polymerase sigma-70 factor (ECF subfamily)
VTLDVEKLYRTYYLKVYSYVMGIVKNPSAAEEITQNTFVKAMVSKDSFNLRSNEYTWLCLIAKNLCYDLFREEGKKADLSEVGEVAAEGKSYEEDFIQKETSFMIHKVLHDMDERYKEVFELRVFGELSFLEISKIFGKTESWARVTYHRARLKIKERMDSNE